MSCQRRCEIWKATDNQYYVIVGDFEHAYDEADCSAFGPFESEDDAFDGACRSGPGNPGGYDLDDGGTRPPPTNPKRLRRAFW